ATVPRLVRERDRDGRRVLLGERERDRERRCLGGRWIKENEYCTCVAAGRVGSSSGGMESWIWVGSTSSCTSCACTSCCFLAGTSNSRVESISSGKVFGKRHDCSSNDILSVTEFLVGKRGAIQKRHERICGCISTVDGFVAREKKRIG